jgi:gamma-glutamyltranspeptidase/glutathione hydrolase
MPDSGAPRRFAIASPHAAASRAGEAAFEAGGNAVDAALAAACALTVVYPHMCALGGDVMALVHDGEAHAINGSGRAPRVLPVGWGTPAQGVGTITVPGAAAAWQTISERWGRRPLAAALEPAADLARAGVPVARSLADALSVDAALVAADAGLSAVFAPDGRVLGEGDRLVHEPLARTLERLARHGAQELYTGETARLLVGGLARLGCALTLDDFALHRTDVEPALRGAVARRELLTMGANSQGFSLIQIMAAVERMRLDDPLGAQAPLLAALFRASVADRDAHLADPAAMALPVEALISDENVDRLVERARNDAAPRAPAAPAARGDTVAVVAVDEGLSVSLIQSVFYAFGAGVLEPRTGIICHNRGACFARDPASANAPGPGKRPLHTLMPLVVTSADRPSWVAGTMGGHAQAQIHCELLLRHLAGGDAQAAVESPRFITGSLEAGGRDVHVEEDFEAALAAFAACGEQVVRLPARSEAVGHAQAIAVGRDGALDAASDPRGDGLAVTR